MRALLLIFCAALLLQADLVSARSHFDRAQYEAAVEALKSDNQANPEVQFLLGKAYYMLGDYKKSTEALEKAAALEPGNSDYFNWLGKAYGRRAETASVFTAPGLAAKARQAFERAVALNPRNLEAINDLFSYYLEAPGFLGGGLEKAARLAEKIRALDPVEYEYAQAQLAVRRKEFRAAEQHFRTAMELAPRQVGRVLDLARFLSNQGRHRESEELIARAEKLAPENPKVIFEKAQNYVRAGRNLDAARSLLEKYIRMPLGPDDPSRHEALKLLKQLGA